MNIKDTNNSWKENDDNDGKKDKEEKFFSCNKYMYKCKNENTLKKHKTLKHEEHICKKCGRSLSTSFDLFLHVAKHHNDTSLDIEGFGDNDEGKFKKGQDNTDKEKAKSVDKVIL